MEIEVVLGGIAFVGLFVMWVVIPGRLRKNRSK